MPQNIKKRIVIAEDHAVLRAGLKSLLHSTAEFKVVGEAEDGLNTIRCVDNCKPDLLLLDLSMPKMDGFSVIREIKKKHPHIKILTLTMHKTEGHILEAFKSGAEGYCLKASSYDELLIAIKTVLAGKQFISPEISGTVLEGSIEGERHLRKKSSLNKLTQREKEVLKLVGEGYQNKEIADYLFISVKTVEKHRANIIRKLDLHSASELTAYAIEKGLVTR